MNILAQIDCTVAVRGLAERWLPGDTRFRVFLPLTEAEL